MSIDPKFVKLTTDVLEIFFKIPTPMIILVEKNKIYVTGIYICFIFKQKNRTAPIRK